MQETHPILQVAQMELLTQVVAVVEALEMAIQVAQAVQESSSFAIQTHSEPLQAQQVHQRSLHQVDLESINLQPLAQ